MTVSHAGKQARILHFSLRSLLILVTTAAACLALRRWLVGPLLVVAHPLILPLAAAMVAVLLTASCCSVTRTRTLVALGSGTSLIVAAGVFVFIAEAARNMDPNYWNWWRQWPTLVSTVLLYALLGAGIGSCIAQIRNSFRALRRR